MIIDIKYRKQIELTNERQKQTNYLVFELLNNKIIDLNKVNTGLLDMGLPLTPMNRFLGIINTSQGLYAGLVQEYKPFNNKLGNEQIQRLCSIIVDIDLVKPTHGVINNQHIKEIKQELMNNGTKQCIANFTNSIELFNEIMQEQ